MNDFFNVLDDFELEEFAAPASEPVDEGTFSLDATGDSSGEVGPETVEVEKTEYTDEALANVSTDKADVTEDNVYVWKNGVDPFANGNKVGVYFAAEGTPYKTGGGADGTLPYTEVALNDITGISLTQRVSAANPVVIGDKVEVSGSAGVSLDLNNGAVTGGSFNVGDAEVTLGNYTTGAAVYTNGNPITIAVQGFDDPADGNYDALAFEGNQDNLTSVTTTKDAGGSVTVSNDYNFEVDGHEVKIKNVAAGDVVFGYNDDGDIYLNLGNLTAETNTVINVMEAGDAEYLYPPTNPDGGNAADQIRIGGTTFTYVNNAGDSYFTLSDGAVDGFVLADNGDSITVGKNQSINIFDEEDTSSTGKLVTVDGSNYTVTKYRNGYSVFVTETSTVTIDDTTLDFTVSKTTRAAFEKNNTGITVYFDEDGNVNGVKGLNLFGTGDSMAVTAPNVTEEEGGIALIKSTTDIANASVARGNIEGYVSVSDGDFTYYGNTGSNPDINVASGVTVYSVSNSDTSDTAQIYVGTNGGTVYDSEGKSYTYSGSTAYFTGVNDGIENFYLVSAGDEIAVKISDPIEVRYNNAALDIPEVEDSDGYFTVSMTGTDAFLISDLSAGSKVDDRFTFTEAGGTVAFDEEGDVTGIDNFVGDVVLYATDAGMSVNGETLAYTFGANTTSITVTGDGDNITKVSGLHTGDYINNADNTATVFEFVTTGGTDVFTVGANQYTVTNDNNGVIYINGAGVVTDLDEHATLSVTPAIDLNVNDADFSSTLVDGEEVIGYEKKNGDISAYVTDDTHPLVTSDSTQDYLKTNVLKVDPATTYYESNVGTMDLSATTGTAEYIFNTSGTNAVIFNDEGKNLAIVDDTATGDKAIKLGNKGDAVIMDGHDEYGSVSIAGGSGNDTIIVRGNVNDLEKDVVYKGTTQTTIDLSQGGADKIITYAEANANIIINNYDEMAVPGAGIVFHDPEIPYIKQDLVDAIKEDLIVFEGNSIIAIDRDETTTGQDRKTQIAVNNVTNKHQTMVRLFGYKDNSDTYSDDYGQLVGFTGKTGGTLDASDIVDEAVILVGNNNNQNSVGSFLRTGAQDDTVFAGGMDTIDTGDGVDLIVLDDTAYREAATIVVGRGAGDAVENLQSGFDGDIFDVTSFDGKLDYEFADSVLGIVDTSSKSTLLAKTDATGQFIEQRFINGSDTLYAAVAAEGGTITVSDSNATVPNYYLAKNGAIDFSAYSGYVGIDVDGQDLDYPSAVGSTSVSIGSSVNSLIGGTGTTIFKGGEGNETLVAGTGESSLYGGGGQNLLVGNTTTSKSESTEFFVIGIHNGAQNSITGFEFIADGASNQATFDNLNLGLADGNEVTDLVANADGSVSIAVKGQESGATEKAVIAGAAGAEMLVDRGTDTETVAQIANSVVTINHDYVDFYAATEKNATVQIGNVTSAKVWLEAPDFSNGVEYVGDFSVIDARGSAAEVEMAGNNVANTIYGGLGNASMWGGAGNANDVMVGGTAHNEYYYEVGNGNDTILSARDGDIVHLGMSLDQIDFDNTNINSNGIEVTFNDGGKLNIDGSAEVSFSFDDGTAVRANRQTGQFE